MWEGAYEQKSEQANEFLSERANAWTDNSEKAKINFTFSVAVYKL